MTDPKRDAVDIHGPLPGDHPDLDAIEARANAATPGPWRASVYWRDGAYPIGPYTRNEATAKQDATFIAHAREDVPVLIARVRALEQAAGRLVHDIDTAGDPVPSYVLASYVLASARELGELLIGVTIAPRGTKP